MVSGDILIRMGDVLIGGGDILILAVLLGFVLLWAAGTVSERACARRDERVLQAAHAYDIGEGVTLRQGVEAYFGGEGDWYVTCSTVYLFAAAPDGRYPQAAVLIDLESWTLEVFKFEPYFTREGINRADALLGTLIRAAKGRTAGP